MKKKILLCMTSHFLFDQRMQRIAYSLSKKYDVSIYNRGCTKYDPYTMIDGQTSFAKGSLFYLSFNLKLAQYIRKNTFDYIYYVDADTLMSTFFLQKRKNVVWIYDSHEWFSEVIELKDKPLKKSIWNYIEKHAVPKMDLCITVNEVLATIFTDRHHQPFISIRNVPFLRPFTYEPSTAKILLYQGAVNAGRGLENMVAAMQQLDGYVLHIYGNGDIKEKMIALVKEKSLQNKVKCFDAVAPDQLWSITCSAYIGLNLLENNSLSYYNSLANKFFDYIHASVPSIHMAFPEYVSIMQNYPVGVCIETLDAPSIIDAITQLSDERVRQQCKEACELAKQEFNWEKEEIKLLQAFDGL